METQEMGKLPGNYNHEEKVNALWRDKNWKECMREADAEMHGERDCGGGLTVRNAVCIDPKAIKRRAGELMQQRGFNC